jgi:hypothetical protein
LGSCWVDSFREEHQGDDAVLEVTSAWRNMAGNVGATVMGAGVF